MLDRHPTDFVELLFGFAFLATGAGFIVHQSTNGSFDAAWIAAIALVTTGLAFLIATLVQRPPREVAAPAATGADAPDPDAAPIENPPQI